MRWLADEHAFQLLVEALNAAAQSRDQCRQGSEGDGNWLRLKTRKQVKWNLGSIPPEKQLQTDQTVLVFTVLLSVFLVSPYSLYEESTIS